MQKMTFNLGDRSAGDGRCLIIGEVAQAHDGSLATAHVYIDAIAEAGADVVKFQTHIADAESTLDEPFRVRFGQDATRFAYWRRMEFTEPQWIELAQHARSRDLLFLSSPFSPEAVDLLTRVGVPAWKIASGTVDDTPTLQRIAATRLPVLLSTGLSTFDEIDRAVENVRSWGAPLLIFQTTSAYPCPAERIGLNVMGEFRSRYGCLVGLSDHSGTIYPSLAAAALGADAVEMHVCLSRDSVGPDTPASVTPQELAQLVRGVRMIEAMRANPVDKSRLSEDMVPLREMFGKRVVARVPLAAGTMLDRSHLAAKKPGGGLPPAMIEALIGRRLLRDMRADEPLALADVSGESLGLSS